MSLLAAPSSTPRPAPGCSGRDVLDRAIAARRARRVAEVVELEAALEWAHSHPAPPDARGADWDAVGEPTAPDSPRALFGERSMALAGHGCPRVAEFAPIEYAAAVGIPAEAALALIGDVLDLAHRLPRIWSLVRELRVPVFIARMAAQQSRDLGPEAADHADRLLAWQPRRLTPHRVGMLVHEARLYADPDRVQADHDHAVARRGVEVRHGVGAPDASLVSMTLDTADAAAFETSVAGLAATLRELGHRGDLGVRRAAAVGVLADPQRALDLMSDDEAVAAEAAYGPRAPLGRAGDATLVLHVTDTDLLAAGPLGHGAVARSARLGPVVLDRLAGWLLGSRVTVRPVVDHRAVAPVDRHDPPRVMVEAVRARDETCVFPHCRRRSEACDLDHVEPYVPMDEGGPPDQTSFEALAPLCRRHHRAKTHAAFGYRRLTDGSYEWTLPSGHVVTTESSTARPRPPSRQRRSPR